VLIFQSAGVALTIGIAVIVAGLWTAGWWLSEEPVPYTVSPPKKGEVPNGWDDMEPNIKVRLYYGDPRLRLEEGETD
jgi:hypothetical protein